MNAATGAIQELQADPTSYAATFGPTVPNATTMATELANAMGWTAMRTAIEALLVYAKSYEAVTWKAALIDLSKVDVVFTMLSKANAAALAGFPELSRLIEVPKVVAQKAGATRARNAKAKATAAAKAALGTPEPAVSATGTPALGASTAAASPAATPTSTTVTVTGGAAH